MVLFVSDELPLPPKVAEELKALYDKGFIQTRPKSWEDGYSQEAHGRWPDQLFEDEDSEGNKMPEDKLTPAQRIRLEALNQSIQSQAMRPMGTTTNDLLKRAEAFETFIADGRMND